MYDDSSHYLGLCKKGLPQIGTLAYIYIYKTVTDTRWCPPVLFARFVPSPCLVLCIYIEHSPNRKQMALLTKSVLKKSGKLLLHIIFISFWLVKSPCLLNNPLLPLFNHQGSPWRISLVEVVNHPGDRIRSCFVAYPIV